MAYKQKGFPMHGTKSALKQMDIVGAREPLQGTIDEEGYEVTEGDDYTPNVKTRAITRDRSEGPVITGDTEVIETVSNRYTDPKTGKVYSTIRGPSAERETETSIVGPKGKQKGKTKVVHDNPVSGEKNWMTKTGERDDSDWIGEPREYDPKTRSFKDW